MPKGNEVTGMPPIVFSECCRLCEKRFSVVGFSKRFGAATPGRRERAGQIAVSQTFFDFCASDELVEEAGVETVPRANSVYSRDFWRRGFKGFRSAGERPLLFRRVSSPPEELLPPENPSARIGSSSRARRQASYSLGKEHIHPGKHIQDVSFPAIIGIIVGVHGSRKPRFLCQAKKVRHARAQEPFEESRKKDADGERCNTRRRSRSSKRISAITPG